MTIVPAGTPLSIKDLGRENAESAEKHPSQPSRQARRNENCGRQST
jgi:hypothetical protein